MLVTVVLLDGFTYLSYLSRIFSTGPTICSLLVMNRIMICILGQDHWIYGCMTLYLIYGVILSFEMAKEIFPVDSDPILRRVSIF
jgi:hypothetical protein